MADGIFPSLVSKDRAVNAVANPIFVQLSDGTGALSVTGGILDVNASVTINAEYQVDDSAGATDYGIPTLAVRDDALTTLTPVDGDYVDLRVNSTGALWVNVANTSIAVTQSGTWILGANSGVDIGDVTVNNGSGAAAVNIQDGGNSITVDGTVAATQSGTWILGANSGVDIGDVTINNAAGASAVNIQDGGNSITVDGSVGITGSVAVTATDLDIRNLNLTDDAVKISGNSTANSATNPIFVQEVKHSVLGTEIHDYTDGTSTGETVSNHDYAVAGTTFLLKSVIVSCSGAMKVEIQTGPVASLATKAVVFLNGRQGDTKQVNFDPPIEVPATSTGTVRLARYSRNGTGNNVDLYSTIIGNDIP